jgi:lipopolysaccharide heptosyltransferase II
MSTIAAWQTHHRSALGAWPLARRILCVRLDSMGDVLMTSPAIAALHAGGRHVTLLTSEAGAGVAALIPEIDDVVVYDAPWMKAAAPRVSAECAADRSLLRDLANGDYDAAVVFTVYSQSALPAALFCHLAGIPLRLAHCRENPYQLLTDWVPDPEPAQLVRHEVRRQLELVSAVGCTVADERLRLRVPEAARVRMRQLLIAAGVLPGRWALVHPGSTAASRRYPPEHFAAAARTLAEATGRTIVFSGSREERPLVESIRARMGGVSCSLAGVLDLPELAALIEAAPLLISNNTGPVHIAAALGTPVVDIYALTNPQHTPWSVPSRVLSHDVPCKHCYRSVCPEGHHDCLRQIVPERVVQAAMELLSMEN